MVMNLWTRIVIAAVVVNLLGVSSGAFIAGGREWHRALQAPPGVPPDWVFGPVWVALYTLMGAAVALIWHRAESKGPRRAAIACFGVQMALNLAWTPVFFGAQAPGAALAVILLLLAAIAASVATFRQVDRTAAWLLAPYALWTVYAAYLNAGFWWLSR